MELHYDITKQDFIDFNLNYYNNNAIVQHRCSHCMKCHCGYCRSRRRCARMLAAYAHAGFHRPVYVALAAVCFWGTPRYMRHKMIKISRIQNRKETSGFADEAARCVKANSSCPARTEIPFTSIRPFSAPQPMTSIIIFLLMNSPRSSCRSQRLKTMRKAGVLQQNHRKYRQMKQEC